jgi:hypothetical protein
MRGCCANQNVQMLSPPHHGSSNGCCFTAIQCKQLRVGLFSPMELSVLRGPKWWKWLGPILPPGFVTVCGTMTKHGPSCAQQFQCKLLAGEWLLTDADTKPAVISLLLALGTDFFYARIQSWVPQWYRCLNANGNFVEVWCVPSVAHVLYICQGQNRVLGFILFISMH